MKKDEKKEYSAPVLTVVTFKSERGYAASGKGLGLAETFGTSERGQEEWVNDNSYLSNVWS